MKTHIYTALLMCQGHCKHLTSDHSFNPHHNLIKQAQLVSSFYTWKNWGIETVSTREVLSEFT